MRVAVIGDSISTQNNGASGVSWPQLLEAKIRDGGVQGWQIDNYSIPGLTWKTAHTPTSGFLIGNANPPVQAMMGGGFYNHLLVMLGVNDRWNSNAAAEFQQFKYSLALAEMDGTRVTFLKHNFTISPGVPGQNCSVSLADSAAIDAVYAQITDESFSIGLGKLYDLGYTYDNLHPTNSGKNWIASAVYMALMQRYPLTPIIRNIAWLYDQTAEVREQMRLANT